MRVADKQHQLLPKYLIIKQEIAIKNLIRQSTINRQAFKEIFSR